MYSSDNKTMPNIVSQVLCSIFNNILLYEYLFFRYAFILYRTTEEAKCNFLRPIDYILLGSECHVKYASYSSFLPMDHQSCDKQTVVVTSIPENVSEDDLRHLFPNCCISKYCPARTVQCMSISTEIPGKIKTFWG